MEASFSRCNPEEMTHCHWCEYDCSLEHHTKTFWIPKGDEAYYSISSYWKVELLFVRVWIGLLYMNDPDREREDKVAQASLLLIYKRVLCSRLSKIIQASLALHSMIPIYRKCYLIEVSSIKK